MAKLRLSIFGKKPTDDDDIQDQKPPSVECLIDQVLQAKTVRSHFFRPSGISNCDRQNVFHYMDAPQNPQQQNPRMMRILDTGTKTHEQIQGYLANHPDYFAAPETKIRMHVGKSLVLGSCDEVLVRRKDGYRFAMDFKTKGNDGFMRLTGPDDAHVDQLSIYMKGVGVKWGVIVYWNKDKQTIKEYPFRLDPVRWARIEKRYEYLYGFVERKELPEYDPKTCDTGGFCSYREHCRKMGAPV